MLVQRSMTSGPNMELPRCVSYFWPFMCEFAKFADYLDSSSLKTVLFSTLPLCSHRCSIRCSVGCDNECVSDVVVAEKITVDYGKVSTRSYRRFMLINSTSHFPNCALKRLHRIRMRDESVRCACLPCAVERIIHVWVCNDSNIKCASGSRGVLSGVRKCSWKDNTATAMFLWVQIVALAKVVPNSRHSLL